MTSTYTYVYETDVDASAEAIWALYEDVSTWPQWDAGAELVTRDGDFVTGATGTMKLVDQAPLFYRLTKVDPLREFVDETPAGPLMVRVSHQLKPLDSGRLRITYRAEIDGPVDDAQRLGPMITSDFPETVGSLIKMSVRSSS